ncbi:hypothetical protein HDV00_006037 [Rhizophlyctis rosea]|nr:hypothetical protein HDV00_006037 [Rhizophlyctis rosea]
MATNLTIPIATNFTPPTPTNTTTSPPISIDSLVKGTIDSDLFVTLICMISIAGFLLQCHALFVAGRDHRLKRSTLTLVQVCTISFGLISIFAGACGYVAVRVWGWKEGQTVPGWVVAVGKCGKPMWVVELTMFLLLSQYRYSVVVPNRVRDVALLTFTLTVGVIYFILSVLEMSKNLTGSVGLLGLYQLGYILFLSYAVFLDNIISLRILRTLLKVKSELCNYSTLAGGSSNSYVLSSKTLYNSRSPMTLPSSTSQKDHRGPSPVPSIYRVKSNGSLNSNYGNQQSGTRTFSTMPPMEELAVKYGVDIYDTSKPIGGGMPLRVVDEPLSSPYFNFNKSQHDLTTTIPTTPPPFPTLSSFPQLPRPSRSKQLSNLQTTIRSLVGNIVVMWVFMGFDLMGSVLVARRYADWGAVSLCVGTTMGVAGLWFFYVRFAHVLKKVVREARV